MTYYKSCGPTDRFSIPNALNDAYADGIDFVGSDSEFSRSRFALWFVGNTLIVNTAYHGSGWEVFNAMTVYIVFNALLYRVPWSVAVRFFR